MKQTVDPVYESLRYVGRRFHPRSRRYRRFVELSPLVDAALLFFLFFFIRSSFVLQPGLHVELPGRAFTSGAEYGNMVVTVTREDLLLLNDELTTLLELGRRLKEAAEEFPDEPLLIQADGEVPHGTLVEIYDIAEAAGIHNTVLGHGIHRSSLSETP